MSSTKNPGFPVRIESWRTSDGRLHSSEVSATHHQEDIDAAIAVTESLKAGSTLHAALTMSRRGWGSWTKEHEIAEKITAASCLQISHWQCRDEAGYRIYRMNTDGTFFVHGDAGSWSGPWGTDVSLSDLLRYAQQTMDRRGGKLPTEPEVAK